jgi:drug/metabolite transporter (DMT)-like permease
MPKHLLTPEFITTFLITLGALGVAGWMIWLDRRPRDSLNPRLLPTTGILMAAGLVLLLALVHLVNLAGIQTGR